MKSKEEIKKDAEMVASAYGYNGKSIALDVINVKDAYCNGYVNGAKEVAIDFANWILKDGFNGLYNDKWVLQTGQEQFDGNPSTSKELFELYLKSKK